MGNIINRVFVQYWFYREVSERGSCVIVLDL